MFAPSRRHHGRAMSAVRVGGRAPSPGGVSGTRSRWGLGNVRRFARDPLGFLHEQVDRHGDLVSMRMLGEEWLLVSHPDDIEELVVKQGRVMGRDAYTVVLQRVLGLGLLTSDGELWKRQRKLMSQAFTPRRIHQYAASMVRVTDAEIAGWRDGARLDLHQEMSRVTMAIAAEVLFGASVSPRDVEVVRDALEDITEFLAQSPEGILGLPAWVPTPRNRRVNRAIAAIDALVYDIIRRRRSGEQRDDLLGTLLAAQDDEGVRMSDRQLRDEVITLFLAGHETTALALSHTFYLLSKHPDVERRLFAELDSVLGGRLPSADDVRSLPFLDRVLKESMRLYPPAWTIGREATEDVELRGHRIAKGTQIMISQWVVHRDPRWFPNPEGFDPDRWLPERSEGLPRYAYFPFGGGPRVCIGNHFAMMEAALALATIAQRHRIELLPGQRLELAPSVTLRNKGPGLKVRLASRPTRPAEIREETAA